MLKLFSDFVAIQSVSADPSRKTQMYKAVSLLTEVFTELGFLVETYEEGTGVPLIVATYAVSGAASSIGIYGHYDVQPEDPIGQWQSPPFKLTLKDGAFFGRGVADNKGHIVQNIAALANLIKTGNLKNNIVFVMEGEEESNGTHIEALLRKVPSQTLQDVEVWYVTDMGAAGVRKPQIFNALRGIISGELVVKTASKDNHSGVFGNRIYNPAQILCDIVAKARDSKTGVLHIPGMYDDIAPLTPKELASLVASADPETELKARSGSAVLPMQWGPFPGVPEHIPLALASKLAPSFDVNGIVSGYTGEGPKTIIPASSRLKFTCRIVAGQKAKQISHKVKTFIEQNIPKGVEYELTLGEGSDAFYTQTTDPWMNKTVHVFKDFFGCEVAFNRSGGTVPAAEILQRMYHKPVILTGFTLPGDNIHAPDENFNEEMFWLGIEALTRIYSF